MTDKTPIEKAAEEISDLSYELMKVANLPMNAKEIADIIRRRLEKEVPSIFGIDTFAYKEQRDEAHGFNNCRKRIGLSTMPPSHRPSR